MRSLPSSARNCASLLRKAIAALLAAVRAAWVRAPLLRPIFREGILLLRKIGRRSGARSHAARTAAKSAAMAFLSKLAQFLALLGSERILHIQMKIDG